MTGTENAYIWLHKYTKPKKSVSKLLENDNEIYENCKQDLKTIGLDIRKLYITDNPMVKFCYVDFTTNNYIDIVGVQDAAQAVEYIKYLYENGLARRAEKITEKRKQNDMLWLYMLVPEVLQMYVFEQIYKELPERLLFPTWYTIYQAVDYIVGDCNKSVMRYVLYKEMARRQSSSEYITIYHGHDETMKPISEEISWTTDLETAQFFAHRFNAGGKVYSAQVPKNKCIIIDAEDTSEAEVLCLYKDLKQICIIE